MRRISAIIGLLIILMFAFTAFGWSEKASAANLQPFTASGQWGYEKPDHTIVIKPQFDFAGEFSEGLAVIQKNGQFGYVDPQGHIHLDPRFSGASNFSHGQAVVLLNATAAVDVGDNRVVYINSNYDIQESLFQPVESYQIPYPYQTGVKLSVFARSGLNMRAQPKLGAQRIGSIPYGKEVVTLEGTNAEYKLTVNGIQGHWVLVEYRGVRGYVFDGYLAHLPAPADKTSELDNYFIKEIGSLESARRVWLSDNKVMDLERFERNCILEKWGVLDTESYAWTYHIPGIRLQEAFLLIRILYRDFQLNSINGEKSNHAISSLPFPTDATEISLQAHNSKYSVTIDIVPSQNHVDIFTFTHY